MSKSFIRKCICGKRFGCVVNGQSRNCPEKQEDCKYACPEWAEETTGVCSDCIYAFLESRKYSKTLDFQPFQS